jgi:hypothetical protein
MDRRQREAARAKKNYYKKKEEAARAKALDDFLKHEAGPRITGEIRRGV